MLYTNPVTLTTSARLKARAFVGSYNASATASALFLEQAPIWDPGPGIWRGWVAAGSDDAEQHGTPGTMSLNLSGLYLGQDMTFGIPTWLASHGGFRFTNIGVPDAGIITEAYIQFTASGVDATTASVTIYGEDGDDAT